VDAASDYGYTALHYAALLPRPELVEVLLAAGASPSRVDQQGQTPLHVTLNALPRRIERRESSSCDPSGYGDEYCYCVDTSHGYGSGEGELEQERSVRRAAEALLRHGASTGVRDERGRAAADILEAKRRPDLLPWLEGARPGAGRGAQAASARPAPGGGAWCACLPCAALSFTGRRALHATVPPAA